jgi:hypothetical protein
MRVVSTSQTSVSSYGTTWRNIPAESSAGGDMRMFGRYLEFRMEAVKDQSIICVYSQIETLNSRGIVSVSGNPAAGTLLGCCTNTSVEHHWCTGVL